MVKQNGHLIVASALLLFTCTAGALTAPFSLQTVAHVDAISISQEPASMLMLGMGLAAFFVRHLGVVKVDNK